MDLKGSRGVLDEGGGRKCIAGRVKGEKGMLLMFRIGHFVKKKRRYKGGRELKSITDTESHAKEDGKGANDGGETASLLTQGPGGQGGEEEGEGVGDGDGQGEF